MRMLLIYYWQECKLVTFWKRVGHYLVKLKMYLLHDPETTHLERCVHTYTSIVVQECSLQHYLL